MIETYPAQANTFITNAEYSFETFVNPNKNINVKFYC